MKVYSLLILFCFLKTLICGTEGVTLQSLQEALNTSLPFFRSLHPEPFTYNIFEKLSFSELKSHNIQFKFDEFGLLHIKFINIKGEVSGRTLPLPNKCAIIYTRYNAKLNNINWEVTYAIESTKTSNGKYDVKFKSMAESEISYNIFRVDVTRSSHYYKDKDNFVIKKVNLTPLKSYLKEISELILDTLKLKLK